MTVISYICEECHKKDENVIKCLTPFKNHRIVVTSLCDICGKVTKTCFCSDYKAFHLLWSTK